MASKGGRSQKSINATERVCWRCKTLRKREEWSPSIWKRGGPCNPCQAEMARTTRKAKYVSRRLKSDYGISLADRDRMLIEQGGRCAICRELLTENKANGHLGTLVDHDHNTGKVRGLLCLNCNTGIGRFKDDPVLMRAAIAYIESRSV